MGPVLKPIFQGLTVLPHGYGYRIQYRCLASQLNMLVLPAFSSESIASIFFQINSIKNTEAMLYK